MDKKLNTPLLEYMLVSYGYEELMGIYGAKSNLNRIIDELKKYNIRAVLEVSTKTILLLKSWGISNKQNQINILKNFFPDTFLNIVIELKKNIKNENWIIFNEHTLVILMKMAILYGKDEGGLPVSSIAEKNDFGIWLLMLSNLTTEEDSSGLTNSSLNDQRASLRRALAKYQFNRTDERLSFKITRYYWIFNFIKNTYRDKIDIKLFLKKATGISYESFLSVIFSLIVSSVNNTSKPLSIEKLNKKWLICIENYFENTSFKKKTIKLAMKQLVGEPELLRPIIKNGLLDNQYLFYDMKVFSRFPLVGDKNLGCVVLTDPRFLYDRASEGAYWITETYLLNNDERKLRNIHSEVWGYGFDQYIRVLFKKTFKGSFKTDLFDGNDEMTDGLIITSKFIFVIENKHHHWKYSAKTTGDETEMKTTLSNLFSSKEKTKGIGQISRFIRKVKSKEWEIPFDIEGKIFVPTLVVSETIPMDAYSRKMYEDKVKESGSFIAGDDVMPFVVMTSEDIEILSCIAEDDGVEEAASVLAGYSASFIMQTEYGYSNNSLPFKSYLDYVNKEVPDGLLMKKRFDTLAKKLEKRIFSKKNYKG